MIILEIAGLWTLGLFVYLARCRRRLLYACTELFIALAMIVLVLRPATNELLVVGPSWWGWPLSEFIGIVLAIYLMVSALDEIEKELPPQMRAKWRAIAYPKGER